MKKCSKCQVKKEENCFSFKNKKLKKLQSSCKMCQSIVHRKHYLSNKNLYIEKSRESNKIYRSRNRDFIREYKTKAGCKFCDETCHVCLDFHHEDPTQKEVNVSRISNDSMSIESIKREIEKCIVVCSNCHRKLHAGLISYPSRLNT